MNTRSVARVLKRDATPAGVGILASRGSVITCAHVVTDALGYERAHCFESQPPPEPLTVDFLKDPVGTRYGATVLPGGWYPAPGRGMKDHRKCDIAILKLERDAPPSTSPAIPIGEPVSGEAFECWGAPDNHGGTADGVLRNEFWNLRRQLDLQRYRNGPFNVVRPGFSGGGVWSQGKLVGMVVMAAESNAEMIPSASLVEVHPALGATPRTLESSHIRLPLLIDRQEEMRRLVKAMDGRPGSFVFVGFVGDPRASFAALVDRIRARSYLQDLEPEQPPENFVRLSWNSDVTKMAGRLLKELSGHLPPRLDRESIPIQVRDTLNALDTPTAIHINLTPGRFAREDHECLREWMGMWTRIDPELTVPVLHLAFFAKPLREGPPVPERRVGFLRRLVGRSEPLVDPFDEAWLEYQRAASDCVPLDPVNLQDALEDWLDGPVHRYRPDFDGRAGFIASVRSYIERQEAPRTDRLAEGLAHLEDILQAPVMMDF